MGACTGMQTSRNIETLYQNLSTERGMLSFTMVNDQKNPQNIKGIQFILVKSNKILEQKINHLHSGRRIKLNLLALAQQHKIELPINQKIQFRFAFVYPQVISQPTQVMQLIFKPLNDLELLFRMNNKNMQLKKQQLIQSIKKNNNSKIAYYQNSNDAQINIVLLGSRGIGKSSFIVSLAKLLNAQNCSPQIGNHQEIDLSTTKQQQKYILVNQRVKVNLVDTPGYASSINHKQLDQMLNNKIAEKSIHTAIIFVNPNNTDSLNISKQLVKKMVDTEIEYVMAFTCWEVNNQVYEDYYVDNTRQKLEGQAKGFGALPTENRIFPISNKQADLNNLYAQVAHLECLKQSIELGTNFYSFHQALHILVDEIVIAVRHRISNKMQFQQFIVSEKIDELMQEEKGKSLNTMFVERFIENKTKTGVILIENEMGKDKKRNLEDYIQIQDKKFRVIKFYLKAPFFSTQLK